MNSTSIGFVWLGMTFSNFDRSEMAKLLANVINDIGVEIDQMGLDSAEFLEV